MEIDSFKIDPETGGTTWASSMVAPSFSPQKQPSKWSCLPTAFSMVLGLDPLDVIASLGHDDERGFHVQELLGISLTNGWLFSPHEFHPAIDEVACCNFEECGRCRGSGVWKLDMRLRDVAELMRTFPGVLVGQALPRSGNHAVAWCPKLQRCIDPVGAVYSIDGFEPETFWLGIRVSGPDAR